MDLKGFKGLKAKWCSRDELHSPHLTRGVKYYNDHQDNENYNTIMNEIR